MARSRKPPKPLKPVPVPTPSPPPAPAPTPTPAPAPSPMPTPSAIPAPALAAGYTENTFSTASFSPKTLDVGATYGPEFDWFLFNFGGATPTNANNLLNADGSITLGQGGDTYSANISSAGLIAEAPYFRGQAFGGGAYITARIKFANGPFSEDNGIPSWWAMALDHFVAGYGGVVPDQWPGQPVGYEHYIEVDILEKFGTQNPGLPVNSFNSTCIDWRGTWQAGYQKYLKYTVQQMAAGFSFDTYFDIAVGWIEATPTKQGSLSFYLNEVLLSTQLYDQFNPIAPPAPDTPFSGMFGIIDQQHLVLILGSGEEAPMTVESVNVYQVNALNNWRN